MLRPVLLLALLIAAVSVASLAPTAAAQVGNCPNGWNGVLLPQPFSADPWGACCSPGWPMTCKLYRLDLPPLLP